ncbi:MAG: DUF5024 domain-containing protein [Prevotella sp.]|nr:DUF5024 domain-containing protein [Prevotella sp.]MBR6494527.1 DUF5024 domain-containing protein [Prevotella sp.]
MNMKRFFIILCLSICYSVFAWSQNSIDKLVEDFSTLGSAKMTSVVDRDPKTNRVLKVVKELELPGVQVRKFQNAFEKESQKGVSSIQQDGEQSTTTVTQKSPSQIRIYMLRKVGRPVAHSAKVIILIKFL